MRMNKIAIGASLLSALFVAGCGDSDSGIPFGSDSGSNPNNPITAPTAGNIAFSVLGGSATGTATVTLLGRGFFVSNQAAPGGTGTQQAPFQNLAQVQAAAAGVNGAEIVVSQGDGTNNGYNTAFALGANQTLRGFSQAATPLLTGPVTFSSGNRLEDVRISGTPGAASAVNAVGASNGIINRVAISNCTSAGNLTDATGTFAISNGSVQNTAAQGYIALSTTGSLNWSVNNSSFNNVTLCSVCESPSGTAAQNMTVAGCSFGSGTSVILANMNTAGTAVGLNVNNCTINGGGTAFRGIDVSVQGTTAFTTILSGNNITGCTGQGIQVGALGNSSVRAKFDSNRTLGNRPTSDLSVGAGNSATLCLVYQNNTAAEYGFAQNLGTTINVEDFGTFGTRNIGLIGVIGNVADVIAGFCGLP